MSCSKQVIHYGDIPTECVACGGDIDLYGQITSRGILRPGLYHAVQDRRYWKRSNWEIYGDGTGPVGDVTNLVGLRKAGRTHTIAGAHHSYNGTHLDEFIDSDEVSIRWFILNGPLDLEEI